MWPTLTTSEVTKQVRGTIMYESTRDQLHVFPLRPTPTQPDHKWSPLHKMMGCREGKESCQERQYLCHFGCSMVEVARGGSLSTTIPQSAYADPRLYSIPRTKRMKVLHKADSYGITAVTQM